MHARLAATRGAAVAVAVIDPEFGRLGFAGTGNISAFVDDGQRRRRLMSYPGIVGQNLGRVTRVDTELPADAVVLLHSDGVRERGTAQSARPEPPLGHGDRRDPAA